MVSYRPAKIPHTNWIDWRTELNKRNLPPMPPMLGIPPPMRANQRIFEQIHPESEKSQRTKPALRTVESALDDRVVVSPLDADEADVVWKFDMIAKLGTHPHQFVQRARIHPV